MFFFPLVFYLVFLFRTFASVSSFYLTFCTYFSESGGIAASPVPEGVALCRSVPCVGLAAGTGWLVGDTAPGSTCWGRSGRVAELDTGLGALECVIPVSPWRDG